MRIMNSLVVMVYSRRLRMLTVEMMKPSINSLAHFQTSHDISTNQKLRLTGVPRIVTSKNEHPQIQQPSIFTSDGFLVLSAWDFIARPEICISPHQPIPAPQMLPITS